MNVNFIGSSAEGWVCELRFPNDAQPTHIFRGAHATEIDEAYSNLMDALVFEIVELREIVALAGA